MLRTQKLTFLNFDFFAESGIQNIITISKIMKLVQKLNSQQQVEHGGYFIDAIVSLYEEVISFSVSVYRKLNE